MKPLNDRPRRSVKRPGKRQSLSEAQRQADRFRERPRRPAEPGVRPKGRLLIIGGHEDKKDERVILRALVKAVGAGKLVVCAVASEEPEEMWDEYERVFRALGVRHL